MLAARRKALGYSQESLARLLEVRAQSVARWEQGASTPLSRYRRPLAQVLEVSLGELEHLIDGKAVAGPAAHPVPSWLDHYTSLEQGAARLQTFEPISVPGLLQTDGYATAVMQASHLPVSEQSVLERVRVRLARQAVLDRRPDPLELVTVIDESVLLRTTGSPQVMVDQLTHLVEMAERPTISIHLVPLDSGTIHCAAFGSFRLFTSAGASMPFMTCTEDLTGFNYLDRRDAIEAHTQLFEHLTAIAFSPADSVEKIQSLTERYT